MSERALSQPQSPEALLKRLLIYNTKHTSCSAKQRKITLRACVCEGVGVRLCEDLCAHLDVEQS